MSLRIALAVANAARAEGVSRVERETDWSEAEMRAEQWDPGAFFFFRVSRGGADSVVVYLPLEACSK